jgi:hypothetical protein
MARRPYHLVISSTILKATTTTLSRPIREDSRRIAELCDHSALFRLHWSLSEPQPHLDLDVLVLAPPAQADPSHAPELAMTPPITSASASEFRTGPRSLRTPTAEVYQPKASSGIVMDRPIATTCRSRASCRLRWRSHANTKLSGPQTT